LNAAIMINRVRSYVGIGGDIPSLGSFGLNSLNVALQESSV